MLNLADRFGIIRLVRKSSEDGKAVARSTVGLLSGIGFLFLPKALEPKERPSG